MFGSSVRQSNPLADAIKSSMDESPQKTRFDEGVDLYWAEKPCPQDPEGKRGWESAQKEIEFGISDE